MSAETLAALEQAVDAHYADVLSEIPETHPVVSGWVLAVEVEKLGDGQQILDNDYTSGERTTINAATGLAVWLTDELRGMHDDEEDEDE